MPHLTPLQTIRKYCVDSCCIGSAHEVRLCPSHDCEFYNWRFSKKPPGGGSTLKVIRAKCIDCSTGNLAEVKRCWNKTCVLYPYRMGKNPNLVGKRGQGNPEALRRYHKNQSEKPDKPSLSQNEPNTT